MTLRALPLLLSLCLAALCCDHDESGSADHGESGQEEAPADRSRQSPEVLYLPGQSGAPDDPLHTVDLSGQTGTRALPPTVGQGPCPSEMVFVSGSFCIDRYEVSLVDHDQGRILSPHFPPSRHYTNLLFDRWSREAPRSRMALGRRLSVPAPPAFQLAEEFEPEARSLAGVLPSGYLTRNTAETACENAGKRLCTREEWVLACRGQQGHRFPYGDSYRDGECNVHRLHHPASLLHGNASINHTDPRLGLAGDEQGPLLRETGTTAACASRWGADAIYDMVGNLDEWIDDPTGTFVGGFYSRATRDGCDSSIETHAPDYFDYSLGTRCCRAPG